MRFEHWFYTLPLRLRSLFQTRRVDHELDEELQYHFEHKIAEGIARGLTPAQARDEAMRAMNGLVRCKEDCRETRRVNLIDDTVQDVRYALRVLAKSPAFLAVAVTTLALAIGANAVVFGLLNAVILRPLNVSRAESLFGVQHGNAASSAESYPDYLDLRDRNRSFEDLAGFDFLEVGLDSGESSTRAWSTLVTGNYFDVLDVKPHLGRFFHSSDEHGPDSAPYLVLSHGSWRDRFAGDPSVVGRVVRINQHPYTILGVAPPEFHGTMLFFFPDFYLPMVNRRQLTGENPLDDRGWTSIFMTLDTSNRESPRPRRPRI